MSLAWPRADQNPDLPRPAFIRKEPARERDEALRPILTISIDDSFQYATDVASVLEANGLRGSFFLDTGRIGRTITRTAVRRLAESHEVGSHSVTHSFMTSMPMGECLREMKESKRELEELTGERVTVFAFPYGDENSKLKRLVHFAGYLSARGARQNQYTLPTSVYDINVSLEVTPRRLALLYPTIRVINIWIDSEQSSILPLLISGFVSAFVELPHFALGQLGKAQLLHILLHSYNFRHKARLELLDRFLYMLVDSLHPIGTTVSELAELVTARSTIPVNNMRESQ